MYKVSLSAENLEGSIVLLALLQRKPHTRSQWKRTVVLPPIVLAQPADISAWQCGDVPGTVPASGLETLAAYAPCAVLFCRGKIQRNLFKKQEI